MKAEPLGDPVHRGGEWTIEARVTVRMTDAEASKLDGLRYEVLPEVRFRLRLRKVVPGDGRGAWRYEVHATRPRPDQDPVVRAGDRPSWDTARTDGHAALLDAKRAATAWEDQRDTHALPRAGTRR